MNKQMVRSTGVDMSAVSTVTAFADCLIRQTEVPAIDAWQSHHQACAKCQHARRRDRRGLCAVGRDTLARRDQAFRNLVTGRL